MAGKQAQAPVDGLSAISNITGMSKSQLYEVMSQVKALIEQNQQQAREILVSNPLLTRALFQAQIMLGMVKPAQVMPNIQQAISQPQPTQVGQAINVQATRSLPGQHAVQGQPTSSQTSVIARQQQPTQTPVSLPPASAPPLTFQSQAIPSQLSATQNKNFLNVQVPLQPLPHPSQIQNVSLPTPAPPQYSILPSHMPMVTAQQQQPLQAPGLFNQPLQPPLPHQLRPPTMQLFNHQLHPQMHHSLGFQPSNAPQQFLSQSLFNPSITTPSTFPQIQPPSHQLYQGGSHLGPDYNKVAGTSIQSERLGPWAPGLQDITAGTYFPGPPPMLVGQMNPGTSAQPARPPPLSPEMEKQLLQQVMSLTPEQISLLPPEQRHQVLQLQEMLR